MPQRLRVLLIVFDEEDAALTRDALALIPRFRADVAVSATYSDGLGALRGREYDIVLLDHRLGANTGLELLGEAFVRTVDVPVVLLTGAADHDVDEAATLAGVSYMLEKCELSATRLERSIRYALERSRAETEIRRMRAFFRAAFDSLIDHVAILGTDGTILAVNKAWIRFALANESGTGCTALGVNYLEVCDTASGSSAEGAAEVARGLRDVIAGRRESFTYGSPCHTPTEQRWFVLKASRFEDHGETRVFVAHEDTTARQAADAALRESEERYRLVAAAMREVVWDLDVVSGRVIRSGATAGFLGGMPSEATLEWWERQIHPYDRNRVRESLADTLAGRGVYWSAEYRLQQSVGAWRDVSDYGYIVRDDDGNAVRVVGTLVDVTERRRAETAAHASEKRYRSLIETAWEGIAMLDGVGTITYANARLLAMLGYTHDEVRGHSLFDFLIEADQFSARTRFARGYRGIAEAEELRFRRCDGGTLWVIASYSQPLDGDELAAGGLVMLTDVTAHKRAELEMAEAFRAADLDRRRLESTLCAIPVGVWLSDEHGKLTHTNPAAAAIWGGSAPLAEGATGYGVYKGWFPGMEILMRPEDWALSRTLASGETHADELVEIERFDGQRAFVLNSAAPIRDAEGSIIGCVVVNVDITERQAEAREREQLVTQLDVERSHLASVFEHAPAFMAVLRGPKHVFERVNAAYVRFVGERELVGKSVADAIPELRGQGFDAILDRVRDTGEPFVGTNLPVQLARGPGGQLEQRFATFAYQRMSDHAGEHLLVAHGWDATDEVLATQALRRNEQRLRDQFDKLPVPTTLWRREHDDFVLVEGNEEAYRAEPSLRQAIGMRGADIYPRRDDISTANMHRCLRENTVLRFNLTYDFGGTVGVRQYELSLGPQQPDRVIVHAVDTTHRAALEAQLRQAQKMEAVGQLASGIAHDFNNLLQVISGNAQFVLEAVPSDTPVGVDVAQIQTAAERAAALTRQLLAFSRQQVLRPVRTDVNLVITEASKLLTRLIGVEIEVRLSLANALGAVVVDPAQLDQVLVNLAVNARDAMPEGGQLEICTRSVTCEAGRGAERDIPPGEYVRIEVRDTGIGMDAHTQARLFEPFFTTKGPGRGTGLGLATVYGIIKQSGGHIRVKSAPGEGTTFSLYLPRVSGNEGQPVERAAARLGERGTETVLVIEDESPVREFATRVLTRQGYHVLQAQDGAEALSLAAAFDAPIHLVLSDASMPGLTGAETCRRLQEQRPDLKVVFMSGYTSDEVLRRGVVQSEVMFVEKPFGAAELARVARQALEG